MDNDHAYTTIKGIDNSISEFQSRLVDGLTEIRNMLHDNQLKGIETISK